MLALATATTTQALGGARNGLGVAAQTIAPHFASCAPSSLTSTSSHLIRIPFTSSYFLRKYSTRLTPIYARTTHRKFAFTNRRAYSSYPGPRPLKDPLSGNTSPIPPGSGGNIEKMFARVEVEGNLSAARTSAGRINTVLNICPQQEIWVVERFGKFLETVGGGLHVYIPIVDKIAYCFSMKEQALIIPSRAAITKDNVRIHCIGVLYYKIVDPKAAAYGCGDPVFALSQLAQTSLRSVIGKLTLDETFHERNLVNLKVVETCNEAAKSWGITCLRHEIREIQPPEQVLHAMERQMEAERKKRVDILQSEGEQQAVINRAEGHKREVILRSEAEKAEAINIAEGRAQSVVIQAQAQREAQRLTAEGAALAIERLATATQAQGGSHAVQFELAQKYIEALSQMAKTNNTMIVPSNVADITSMIAQATSVYKSTVGGTPTSSPPSPPSL